MTDSMTPGEGMASDGGADKPSGAVARRWRDTTTYGPKPLAALLPGVTRPTFRKRAPATAQVLADWAEIVGPVLAAQTSPRRLSGSTLTLACAGPVALELQHLSGALIQRINGHLGGQVIERLRFVQETLPSPPPIVPRRAAEPVAVPGLPAGDLHDALARLGGALQARRRGA